MAASTVQPVPQWMPASGLALGAVPTATFPNSHLLRPSSAGSTWVAARRESPVQALRAAVQEEDWERNFEEGLTLINMRSEWCASEERCSALSWLATSSNAKRVLEVGSFCGAASLSIAEALPADGEVYSIELDPFAVNFGRRYRLKSLAGGKVKTTVGRAYSEMKKLATQEGAKPFDLVIIDADKEGMQPYFELVLSSPNLLSENGVICVDMTPHKGNPPIRYVKFGFPHRWQSDAGEKEMQGLRDFVKGRSDLQCFEFGSLLVAKRQSKEM